MPDLLLFIVLPYIALLCFIVVPIVRIRFGALTISSMSSQFLESKTLFWGSNAWHYGLLIVLPGHLIGFLIPNTILAFNAVPLRLFILEVTGLIGGVLMGFGIVLLLFRRVTNDKVLRMTSAVDIFALLLLLLLVITGITTAIMYRWGSSWYAAVLVPYLYSILAFNPQVDYVATLPYEVKMHILLAFVLIGVLPFTKLIHAFSIPLAYPFRPPQVVRWNWNPQTIRDPEAQSPKIEEADEEEKPEKWTQGI